MSVPFTARSVSTLVPRRLQSLIEVLILAAKGNKLVPISPGYRLGPYELLGLLGVRGMRDVCRAKDVRLDREVAVKVLPVCECVLQLEPPR